MYIYRSEYTLPLLMKTCKMPHLNRKQPCNSAGQSTIVHQGSIVKWSVESAATKKKLRSALNVLKDSEVSRGKIKTPGTYFKRRGRKKRRGSCHSTVSPACIREEPQPICLLSLLLPPFLPSCWAPLGLTVPVQTVTSTQLSHPVSGTVGRRCHVELCRQHRTQETDICGQSQQAKNKFVFTWVHHCNPHNQESVTCPLCNTFIFLQRHPIFHKNIYFKPIQVLSEVSVRVYSTIHR